MICSLKYIVMLTVVLTAVMLVIFTIMLPLSRGYPVIFNKVFFLARLALVVPVKESLQPNLMHTLSPFSYLVFYFREVTEKAKRLDLLPL